MFITFLRFVNYALDLRSYLNNNSKKVDLSSLLFQYSQWTHKLSEQRKLSIRHQNRLWQNNELQQIILHHRTTVFFHAHACPLTAMPRADTAVKGFLPPQQAPRLRLRPDKQYYTVELRKCISNHKSWMFADAKLREWTLPQPHSYTLLKQNFPWIKFKEMRLNIIF